jgi:DNA-binding LytR/AlgR family response regulator
MNCIIIDDDEIARLIVKKLCNKIESVTVVKEFPNAIEAIKYLNKNTIDLVFLDIHMPSFSGFDFIQTLTKPPKIILTTSDRNFAIRAFEYDCIVDYLVKPLSPERFTKAIDKLALKETSVVIDKKTPIDSFDYLYVSLEKRLIKIDIPKIYLVEAKGDYINIKTTKRDYIVHSTLRKIEKKLPPETFIKVHRSFIINISEIVDIEDFTVLVRKSVVPLSRPIKTELIRRLNLL